MALIAMMVALGMPQSAAAYERAAEECISCHKAPVTDKVAQVELKIIAATDRKGRQTMASYSQLKQHGFLDNAGFLANADYVTGYKSRPGWRT
jgi:hypothetical protein